MAHLCQQSSFANKDELVMESLREAFRKMADSLAQAAKQSQPGTAWKAIVRAYLSPQHCDYAECGPISSAALHLSVGLGRHRLGSLFVRSPATASAEQVQIGAGLKQGIGGGFNSIYARDRIKDNAALLSVAVSHNPAQGDFTKLDLRTAFRPLDGGVVNCVSAFGQLHYNAELYGTFRDALFDLVEKKVGAFGGCRGGVEVLITQFWQDAVATKAGGSVCSSELNRGDGKERLPRKTSGNRLESLDKLQGLGM